MARSRRTGETRAAESARLRREIRRAGYPTEAKSLAYLRRLHKRDDIAALRSGMLRAQRATPKNTAAARARGYPVRKGRVLVPQEPGISRRLAAGREKLTGPHGERLREARPGGLTWEQWQTLSAAEKARIDRGRRSGEVALSKIEDGPVIGRTGTSVSEVAQKLEKSPKRPPRTRTRFYYAKRSYYEQVLAERRGRTRAGRQRRAVSMRRLRAERREGRS